jgi:DNA-directed RNA polymerase beta subunit
VERGTVSPAERAAVDDWTTKHFKQLLVHDCDVAELLDAIRLTAPQQVADAFQGRQDAFLELLERRSKVLAPEYPRQHNDAWEWLWSITSTLEGTNLANGDLAQQVADLTRQLEEARAERDKQIADNACLADISEAAVGYREGRAVDLVSRVRYLYDCETKLTTAEARASEAERRVEELEAKLSSIESREYGKNMGLAQPQEPSDAT